MFRLILVAAASALMLAQASAAPAYETKDTSRFDRERPQTAWASSRGASVSSDEIVGENCYIERELVTDAAGRVDLRAEVICD